METTITKNKKSEIDPFVKLKKRILREFIKVKYIGDISISDEEYERLLRYLSVAYKKIQLFSSHEVVDPILAVTLVQIGIRNYNGRFWSHVAKHIDGSFTAIQQGWIGRSFVKTLAKYNKVHVGADEMVNNILMHSFITKYYAGDFFDFLFAYYQRDLDRDLTRHTKEMRNYLIESMKKGENSVRSYKIKKHTSDAVTANETGCKIRIRRILRFIDNYFFNDALPKNTNNRVTRLFIEWAETSKSFENAKKEFAGLGRRGQKSFSAPYFKFDIKTGSFLLVLPSQNIRLEDDEAYADICWRINLCNREYEIEAECDGSVTGCKTRIIKTEIDNSADIFEEFKIELVKNNTVIVRRFVIKNDCVRFFDKDWDLLNTTNHLPVGDVYAFTKAGSEILSESIVGVEKLRSLNLYNLLLEKGDFVKLPNGKAKSAGRDLEEGLLMQHLVSGAQIINNEDIPVFSSNPLLYFTMEEKLETGTVIEIDNQKYRFDIENCIKFQNHTDSEKFGYILKLEKYSLGEGIHEVNIDIPNSKKNRNYKFAFIRNLKYKFIGAPYIFKEQGEIVFDDAVSCEILDDFVWEENDAFAFDILPDENFLNFNIKTTAGIIGIKIPTPVFKWKFDDYEWETAVPEVVWYQEFPRKIYLKYPSDTVRFYMNPPEVLDSGADDDDDNYETSFTKSKTDDIFECDTTKMPSWFGRQDAIRKLHIDFGDKEFIFARVITKCILHTCKIDADYSTNQLILKSDISGLADCFADVMFNDELIAEKVRITTRGARINAPLTSGKYSVIFYEQDDEEDEFGFGLDEYAEFDKRICTYKNPYDLTNKKITLENITKKENRASIFKADTHYLSQKITISNLERVPSEPMTYEGEMKITGEERTEKVKIKFLNPDKMSQAYIYIVYRNSYRDCLYDTKNSNLITGKNIGIYLNTAESSRRFLNLSEKEYYFSVNLK